ncbi:hypothetical protein [Altererythrobacter sp. MTPC7]|nr:hypothetical protein PF049_06085 [Erythrobacteraceae bacterium WH01K]
MASNDMNAANSTYSSFIASLKWILPLIAVITFLVVVMIAS